MKKRKGTYTVTGAGTAEQPGDEAITAQAKKSKKHKKDKCLTNHDADNGTFVGQIEEARVMTKKKKKKKKHKDSDDVLARGADELEDGIDVSEGQPKEMMKPEENVSQEGSDTSPDAQEDRSLKVKKKKKKDKHKDDTNIELTCHVVENNGGKKGHKKKNKVGPVNTDDMSNHQPADIDVGDSDSPSKMRGKKRKHKSSEIDETGMSGEVAAEETKENTEVEVGNLTEEVPRRKKKHKSKDKDNNSEEAAAEVSKEESETPKKKKKKRKHAETDNCEAGVEAVQPEDLETTPKKKKKRKHTDTEENNEKDESLTECADSPAEHDSEGGKKKKKKRKNKEEKVPTNTESLKEPKGYVNGDNSAAQSPEVASESNSQAPSSAGNSSLGQWKTASFETGDRQSKFFRLLGGFKKSTDSPDSSMVWKKAGLFKGLSLPGRSGNLALSATEQSSLHDNLETQFEKARSLATGKQKGGGLGFSVPPGEGKKFYIDSGNSKSVKFD